MGECQDLWEETKMLGVWWKGNNTWKFFIWEVLEYIYETRESHSLKSAVEVTWDAQGQSVYKELST